MVCECVEDVPQDGVQAEEQGVVTLVENWRAAMEPTKGKRVVHMQLVDNSMNNSMHRLAWLCPWCLSLELLSFSLLFLLLLFLWSEQYFFI